MNRKHLRDTAIFILVVFAITVVIYPLVFSPDQKTKGPPVELELGK